jgi:hypothetical protein
MVIQTKKIIIPLQNWIGQQLIRITDLYKTSQNSPLVGTLKITTGKVNNRLQRPKYCT